jgi:hypothetical protein
MHLTVFLDAGGHRRNLLGGPEVRAPTLLELLGSEYLWTLPLFEYSISQYMCYSVNTQIFFSSQHKC